MSKSSIITSDETSADLPSPVTSVSFLKRGVSCSHGHFLNIALRKRPIPAQRIGRLSWEKRRVTADTDFGLMANFGVWMKAITSRSDGTNLEAGERRDRTELDKIVPVQQAIAL